MLFSPNARYLFRVIKLNDQSIWKKFFEGRFEDKDYAIQRFNDHIEDVKNNISPDRLLIYEIGSGWEPLCDFLQVGIPSTPYPTSNKGENFHTWATGVVKETLGSRF